MRKIGDITEGSQYPFHYLILAAGARHSYFGNDHWEAFAPGLKNLSDALELRRRILNAFEIAETAADAEVQQAAMTFVVMGAELEQELKWLGPFRSSQGERLCMIFGILSDKAGANCVTRCGAKGLADVR